MPLAHTVPFVLTSRRVRPAPDKSTGADLLPPPSSLLPTRDSSNVCTARAARDVRAMSLLHAGLKLQAVGRGRCGDLAARWCSAARRWLQPRAMQCRREHTVLPARAAAPRRHVARRSPPAMVCARMVPPPPARMWLRCVRAELRGAGGRARRWVRIDTCAGVRVRPSMGSRGVGGD